MILLIFLWKIKNQSEIDFLQKSIDLLIFFNLGAFGLHSLLSSRYGDRVQAQSTSTGACDLQFASRHGSIRSWQRGRQAGEGEEGEGPAPLLKSRDPLLAGGEKTCKAQHTRLQHGHIQKQLYNIYDFLPYTQ